ncbi:hypothetical protein N806_29765 [Rhodococcus sp. P27]|nr:hypothetical protein N806_29765 [Rhodococcus sp. P27]
MNNIFDSLFNGMAASEMYRSWTIPEMFPDQPQPRLENWSAEDLEAYCGIYAKETN